ncbi:MAG: CPBP family intramembrane glutamic endopeptidase [Planctomycetota bacterium]
MLERCAAHQPLGSAYHPLFSPVHCFRTMPPPPPDPLVARYWAESRRPLESLAFIAPWMLIYEMGVLVFGVRNGADAWMRGLLSYAGLSQHFLLPVLTVGILLGWQHLSHASWRVSRGVLATMLAESIVLGLGLWLFAVGYSHFVSSRSVVDPKETAMQGQVGGPISLCYRGDAGRKGLDRARAGWGGSPRDRSSVRASTHPTAATAARCYATAATAARCYASVRASTHPTEGVVRCAHPTAVSATWCVSRTLRDNSPPLLSIAQRVGTMVSYLGAGIYEELLFRLILLSAALWAARRSGLSPAMSAVTAVLATSLLFSAAHYWGPLGDEFELSSFVFRLLAGVYFSVVFIYRGFGLAAGAHAVYDLLVTGVFG